MGTSEGRGSESFRVNAIGAPGGGSVLKLVGELDLGTVTIFIDALDEILDGDFTTIELDMSELTFIDSSGVGAYVTAYRKAHSKGSQLRLGSRSDLVDRVLQLSGVEDALAREAADKA